MTFLKSMKIVLRNVKHQQKIPKIWRNCGDRRINGAKTQIICVRNGWNRGYSAAKMNDFCKELLRISREISTL